MSGFQLATGSETFSRSTTYMVQSILGQGSFGTVAKCTNMCDNTTVAIKTMKDEYPLDYAARKEVNALLKLSVLDTDKSNIVQWHKAFTDRGHFCIVFEHLDKSLLDFMEERNSEPLLLSVNRPIIQQVANALDHLKTIGMIHADLKLDNVMLVDHQHQPYRVKVIDFGLAEDVSATTLGSYVGTCQYKAPEIFLGLPYTEAIDMWSLGIMAASMYLGTLLYPGLSDFDMMRFIVETQGPPPDNLLNKGLKTSKFFQRVNWPNYQWKIKNTWAYLQETGIRPEETRRFFLRSLDDLLNIGSLMSDTPADRVLEIRDKQAFVDMLKGMLQLDAANRLTPCQVLEHSFITMSHLISRIPYTSYVISSLETMAASRNSSPGSNSGNAGGSSQPSPPSKPQPSQQSRPASPIGSSCSQDRSRSTINPHPHTPSLTSGGQKGRKRKLDEVDDSTDESCKSPKKVKSGHSETPACPSASCSSQHGADKAQMITPKRDQPVPPPPTDHNTTLHSSLSQVKVKDRSGLKRKAARDEDEEMLANLNPPSRTVKLHLLVAAAALTSHGPPSTLILTLLLHQQVEERQGEKESLMTLMEALTKPAFVLKKSNNPGSNSENAGGSSQSSPPQANLNPPSRAILLLLLVAAAAKTGYSPPSTLILTLLPHQQVETRKGEKESLRRLMEALTKPASLQKKSGHSETPACQSTSCSSQSAADVTQTVTPLRDHPIYPPQQNTKTQEREKKKKMVLKKSDQESPQTDHNTTLYPSLSQAEDQGQSGLKRKAARDEDELEATIQAATVRMLGGLHSPPPIKHQLSQQNCPALPAGSSSSLDQSWSTINPHPHTPSSSTSGGQKGRKRKLDDVDGSSDETCNCRKKVKSGHSSQSAADVTQTVTPLRDHPIYPPQQNT
ncbi:homeodomain-interacting protein kinase 1-like isoform X1 [Xyrichtys novacula]|uniref:Homeodomain-interacting protein kinase 1-like isoform X1 n=1 Tax=Xyrichtys novacula TaxID=13765 RepID=A0AAV1EJ97_XYRNO|nr:homeodomain-interacting protein kinase 1-like isoform X1 [Xyrichtys novacula]